MSFAWLTSLSGLVLLMSFIEAEKTSMICSNVRVLIPGNQNLIERAEVDRILLSDGGALIGRKMNTINIQRLEENLEANPFIRFAKVYADMNGVLKVEIGQREPILRIINVASMDFYVDREGVKMPLSENFTANVLIANGLIYEDFDGRVDTLKTDIARDLYKTAAFIYTDTLWNNQIEQLYVNLKNEIEMIPRVGSQKIILGNADSLKVKLNNLYLFYKKALPRVGWDTYKTINIKYANQVIAEKNTDTLKTDIAAVAERPEKAVVLTDSLTNTNQDTTKN